MADGQRRAEALRFRGGKWHELVHSVEELRLLVTGMQKAGVVGRSAPSVRRCDRRGEPSGKGFQPVIAAAVPHTRSHKLRVARISRAGVRSPVQLIRRGAFKNVSVYPSFRYRDSTRAVA